MSTTYGDDRDPTPWSDEAGELNLDELEKVTSLKKDALRYYRQNMAIEALDKLQEAIKILPGDLELLYYEALCLYKLNNLDKAASILQSLSELDESALLPDLPKMLSLVLLKSERFDDAYQYLEEVCERRSNDAKLLSMYGYCLEHQGHFEKAEEVLRRAQALEPQNPNVLNSLAYVLYRQNKHLNEAQDLVRKALQTQSKNPAYLDTLGMILAALGNAPSAKEALKKALKFAPQNSTILSHLSKLGQKQ